MRDVLSWLRYIVLGAEKPPPLEEDSFPRDTAGQPDLTRFTRPVAQYAGYIQEYLVSLSSPAPRRSGPPRSSEWQSYAYRKGVLGQWGLIARGPAESLPAVLELLRHPVAEGRQAGAGVLEHWTRENRDLEAPVLALAQRELDRPDSDIETLSVLMGVLGRMRSEAALPLVSRVLRAPESSVGDLDWSAIEALQDITGQRFVNESNPKQAADRWLRERGF
jgi:hypothetical protein